MGEHERKYMLRALELAVRAQGRTSPNPLVGAVLVKDGRIIGEGFHRRAGGLHAEVEALRAAGEAARGATAFVTLEPCAHHGRTPPCVDALIEAGVAQVYSAGEDPNPHVNGGGHARLRAAGIQVQTGLCSEHAREINRPFFKYIACGRPWVTAKFAMSLDGKLATRRGDSQWITGEAARGRGHQLRNMADAVLVGSGTVLADDPRLTTRLPEHEGDVRHPLRIVVDSSGRVPGTSRIFSADLPGDTALATTAAAAEKHCGGLQSQGVQVWRLPADGSGRVDLGGLLDEIGRRDMLTLLVEGGGVLTGSLVDDGLLDEVYAFVAPMLIGGRAAPGPVGDPGAGALAQALRLGNMVTEQIGADVLIRANVRNPDEGESDRG